MAKKRHHDSRVKMLEHREYYAGEDSRHMQEKQDGAMLHEDKSALAFMPREVMMKYYPSPYDYLPEDLDDGISGVDRLMGMNDSKRDEHMKPKKT
jgi:hypothetical protein